MYWMQTYTGKKFYPLNPKLEDVDIHDIAHGLSLTCRYSGQCINFYSVAEHSCIMSDYISDEYKLLALMHDAAEAYICDFIRPIKLQLKEYKNIQNSIAKIIYEKYKIDYSNYAAVKDIDNRILRDERTQNMSICDGEWIGVGKEPLGVKLNFWEPKIAESEFLTRFDRLYK